MDNRVVPPTGTAASVANVLPGVGVPEHPEHGPTLTYAIEVVRHAEAVPQAEFVLQ
jgi:hypothetical protein